jgi:predicted dehydrogenase
VTGRRRRAGLVGTGLIAQVMHLYYLTELAGRFAIAAVCDIALCQAIIESHCKGGPADHPADPEREAAA